MFVCCGCAVQDAWRTHGVRSSGEKGSGGGPECTEECLYFKRLSEIRRSWVRKQNFKKRGRSKLEAGAV